VDYFIDNNEDNNINKNLFKYANFINNNHNNNSRNIINSNNTFDDANVNNHFVKAEFKKIFDLIDIGSMDFIIGIIVIKTKYEYNGYTIHQQQYLNKI